MADDMTADDPQPFKPPPTIEILGRFNPLTLGEALRQAGLYVAVSTDRVTIPADYHDADVERVRALVAAHDPSAPAPAPFQDEISRRQFFQQLAIEGDITQDEALAAVQAGTIPDKLQAVIATLPASDRFNAKMLLAGATTFKFSNPITAALAAALTPPRTTEQMKALWTAAALLV